MVSKTKDSKNNADQNGPAWLIYGNSKRFLISKKLEESVINQGISVGKFEKVFQDKIHGKDFLNVRAAFEGVVMG
jgi:hypothetical protein